MRTMKMRLAVLTLALIAAVPSIARADATAFLGRNTAGDDRSVTRGFAAGVSLLVVGFEFEYANTSEDELDAGPGLRTYMGNGLLQTPFPIAGFQLYATAGGGVYQETLLTRSETHVGINVGGGVKMSLIGPLRLRLDYRVFTLKGEPLHANPQRFYAGLNLKF